MAKIPLKEIVFPGLDNTYTIPEIDNTLSTAGKAADAKKTGDEIDSLKSTAAAQKDDVLKAFPTDSAQGAVASFSDGAELQFKSLVVDIDPVQDLHGQGAPYPAGGGKNLLPSIDATFTDSGVTWTLNSDGSVKLSGTATANSVYDFGRNVLSLPAGNYVTHDITVSEAYLVTIFKVVNGSADVIQGGGGSFNLTEDASIFVRYFVPSGVTVNTTIYPQIEAGSTATAYAPYSNICPISGWSEVNVEHTGKNLYSREAGEYNVPVFDTSGNSISYADVNVVWVKVKPNTEYTITLIPNASETTYLRWIECDKNKNYIWRNPTMLTNSNPTQTITTRSNTEWLQLGGNQYAIANIENNAWEAMLTEGSTATPYEPYSGQSINIALGQTVYGGKLDVTKGELVIDYAKITIDESSTIGQTGSAVSSPVLIQVIPPAQDIAFIDEKTIPRCLCGSYLPPTTAYGIYRSADLGIAINQAESRTSRRIWMRLPEVTTEAQAKTYLTNNPIEVVYPIYNPITVQLTPHEVTALLGSNNVWADSGNSDVEYRADPTLYINKKIAEAISALS